MKSRMCLMVAVSLGVALGASAQNVYWIPAAAHTTGVGTSVWRTDLAVTNLSDEGANVQLKLHADGHVTTSVIGVPAGQQRTVEDVVEPLGTGNTTGSIEVVSDSRLIVRSRTYNDAPAGTFGQALDGITSRAGLGEGERALLIQLREDTSFRCNIGVVNMGGVPATVQVDLYESSGVLVGTYDLEVAAGELRQDGRPFAARFGRTDVSGGSAEVTLVAGEAVYAYASVIDNRTGDPTTIEMESPEPCEAD